MHIEPDGAFEVIISQREHPGNWLRSEPDTRSLALRQTFLDKRGQAGDYAYQRATDHAREMLEAINSNLDTDPRMRSLAPDLSIAPLLEP
jgi:hypothetical protein